MELFIAVILITAGVISFAKLALLPRIYSVAASLMLFLLALLFQERLAQSSLAGLTRDMTGGDALRSWCALLVIQELLVCIAGARMLQSVEDGQAPPKWNIMAFFPSVLLPVGVIYLKLVGFNYLLDWDFTTISLVLAVSLPVIGFGISETARAFFPDREILTEKLLQGELLFVMLGIFLPAAAIQESQSSGENTVDWMTGFPVLAGLMLPAAFAALICNCYRKYKYRRLFHDIHHSNS